MLVAPLARDALLVAKPPISARGLAAVVGMAKPLQVAPIKQGATRAASLDVIDMRSALAAAKGRANAMRLEVVSAAGAPLR